ncbi:hypothetical protein [Lutispora sp.]|uniref:hypothetical protein n=1 Tax=Lutispora sp. TaxID=2828727 RepID=UPI003564BBAF
MEDKKVFIEEFISKVKDKYRDLIIGYEFDDEDNAFDIWHTGKHYESNDEEFLSYTGELIRDVLFANGIFNISFGYDYLKTRDMGWKCNNDSQNTIQITKGEVKVSIKKEDSIPKIYINTRILVKPGDIIDFKTDFIQTNNYNKNYLQPDCFFEEDLDKYKQIPNEEFIQAA